MKERIRKIVLVGAQGYERSSGKTRVDCVPWEAFSKRTNLRDYDVVVLNLLPLRNINNDEVDWVAFFGNLDFGAVLEITQNHEGMIFVVGDPRLDTSHIRSDNGQGAGGSFLRWTGVEFEWDDQGGDTVLPETDQETLSWYFRNLKHWQYSLRNYELQSEGLGKAMNRQLRRLGSRSGQLDLRIEPLCRNRYGYLLSFLLYIVIQMQEEPDYSYPHTQRTTSVEFGPVVFFPETSLNEDETLRFILDVCGAEPALELPSWSTAYALFEESKKKDELRILNEELEDISNRISDTEESIAEIEKLKILFTGSGRVLETQARRVFEELGFDVQQMDPNRDDLILKYEDKVAVVEVKGVSKSAAERNAAQLEKYVSEYHSLNDVQPKGVLLINAYCNTPLDDRTGTAFPDQMLGHSKRRGHCLITGIQLLGLYLDCKDDPEKGANMIEQIFATEGMFEGYLNWPDFLTIRNRDRDT